MKSSSQAHFAKVPNAEIQRSSFDRSHNHKTTFDIGTLVPVYVDEALPGDTFNLNMSSFARLATPIKPIMDNMYMDSFFFAVPIRLLWDNWQKFNGEQSNPGDSTDYLIPTLTCLDGGFTPGGLADYFGVPTGVNNVEINSLWHRAYYLIYNEWFRDQNLQDASVVPKGDGPDIIGQSIDDGLRRRGKRHDYFTSCLPWPQKGEAVSVPIGGFAPVGGIYKSNQVYPNTAGTNPGPLFGAGAVTYGNNTFPYNSAGVGIPDTSQDVGWVIAEDPLNPGFPNIYADLSEATSVTINRLRESFQVQKLYERDARGGTRYTEIIKSHFGVTSPDARLQRPEYLGGGSSMVNIAPIAQTSGEGDYTPTPQGNLAGVGTVSATGHGFTKSFTEHCILIGLVSVRADLTYQQGLNRMFSRQTRFDYYWPALAHLGEQEVLQKEIYITGAPLEDNTIFGYQERYAEYRYKPSIITGKFRSQDAQSLDLWHLSQDFASAPHLNDEFIVENPPLARCIAVPTEPHFLFDSYFKLKCARPMPTYSVPGLIDHF